MLGYCKVGDRDSLTEKRIAERCHSVDVGENGVRGSVFSEFQLEVFSVVDGLIVESRKGQIGFMLPPNYQELVNNVLNSIEEKKSFVKEKKNR